MASQRLLILVRDKGIDTLVSSDGCWRETNVEVDVAGAVSTTKILEEAVYNSPKLLAEYGSVDVVADSDRFIIVPAELADDRESIDMAIAQMWPNASADDTSVDVCGSAAFLTVFDRSLVGFISRTFVNAALHGRLAMLASFFMSLSAPVNRVKLYAHFVDPTHVDIVALTSTGLLMANSFKCNDPADAVYFIMASVKDCGFDELDDEMLLCGDQEACVAVTETLRQYVNSVMPLLLPISELNVAFELQTLKK